MSFLDDYEPVADRLARFWQDHPSGRVSTELVSRSDTEWVFRAAIYRDVADLEPFATGYAHEQVTARGVNATSACECGETSALGRALANGSYSSKQRPSREEMAKTQRARPKPEPVAKPAAGLDDLKRRVGQLSAEQRAALKSQFGWPPSDLDAFVAVVDAYETETF